MIIMIITIYFLLSTSIYSDNDENFDQNIPVVEHNYNDTFIKIITVTMTKTMTRRYWWWRIMIMIILLLR